jgi:hypothetical protein
VQADNSEYDVTSDTAIFTGNVVIRQGERLLLLAAANRARRLAEESGRLSAVRPTKLTGCESHQGVKGAREVSLVCEAHS